MIGPIFTTSPLSPGFKPQRAFFLSSLLRGHEYTDGLYVYDWATLMGCAPPYIAGLSDGWPLPYSVVCHPDGVIVAFSGLRNLTQALQYYLNCGPRVDYRAPGQVLHVLSIMYDAVKTTLESKVGQAPNKTRIILTGHSAGGAMCRLAYHRLKTLFAQSKFQVYTFGAPKPGNAAFSEPPGDDYYAVENEGDPVPSFPYWTTRTLPYTTVPISLQVPVNAGRPVQVKPNGDLSYNRPWLSDPALPRVALSILQNPASPQGVAHGIKEYNDRLYRYAGLRTQNAVYDPRFEDLYRAMQDEVDMLTKLSPQTPRVDTPAATPPAPTVAVVQEIPTYDGNPTNQSPPPNNTALVGVTHRVEASATVTTSRTPPPNWFWRGDDRRHLERMLYAVRRMLRRDTLVGRRPISPELSNQVPFFDATNTALYFEVLMIEDYLQSLLNMELTTVPAIPA